VVEQVLTVRPSTLLDMPVRKLTALVAVPLAAIALFTIAGCGNSATDDPSNPIARTTTLINGAGVVGIERDTTKACPIAAPADPADGSTRRITHAGGESVVPADPQRIVVLSTQALDSVCAVGMWERVVGAATVDGPTAQPEYLGTGIALIPSIGIVGTPDPAQIEALHPDLILGSTVPDPALADRLKAIAPTVYDAVDGGWKRQFGLAAQALGRGVAAIGAIAAYEQDARDAGVALNSGQTQASIVRFSADSTLVEGTGSFAGQILTDAGVRRPGYQRDASFTVSSGDLDKADADIIYVSFEGDRGLEHGKTVLDSDQWEDLGASKDRRVFAVEDAIWNGNGLVAARSLVDDLRSTLNSYVTG
jgi:iron complex transport system substrate-binding protein